MQYQSSLELAIEKAAQYGRFFCKFISPNDTGMTGGHQEGVHISKEAWSLFFDSPGTKDENKEEWIKIHWEEGCPPVESRAVWYGRGTRSEYRITRFWTNSPFDKNNHVGDLLILVRADQGEFYGFILSTEERIETFLDSFSISLTKTSAVYGLSDESEKPTVKDLITRYASTFDREFPSSIEIALKAREVYFGPKEVHKLEKWDDLLLDWIETEYRIFQAIEESVYRPQLTAPFGELDKLIEFANSALNRRKSRAGKSLEHHVDFILTNWEIPFSHPGRTEGNKKPDFLFPSNEAYADYSFENDKLTFLGVKTTCKDRWRQILNEANRIPVKHLLTLQQGITKNQLEEMRDENVVLVVPKKYHGMYPPEFRSDLLSVTAFLSQLKESYCPFRNK